MSKHTPGPWGPMASLSDDETIAWTPIQGKLEAAPGLTIGSLHNTEAICRVFGYLQPVVANARLIAAAPEMLSFLQDLEDALSYEVRKIKESPQESAYNARGLGIALQIVTKKARAVIAKATREEED